MGTSVNSQTGGLDNISADGIGLSQEVEARSNIMSKRIQVSDKQQTRQNSKHKFRILHVVDTLCIGGAENYVVNLANSLDENTFQTWIAYCDGKTLGIDGEALAKRVKREVGLIKFNSRKIGSLRRVHNLFYNSGIFFVLHKSIKRHKIDLVHTHLMTSAPWAWIAAKVAGVPVVYGPMAPLAPVYRLEWLLTRYTILCRILDKFVDRYIALSDFLKKDLETKRRINSKKIERIHLGVDLSNYGSYQHNDRMRAELNIDDGTLVVGVIARLSPEKGVHKALKAFPHVLTKVPEAKLLIVGDGPIRGQLEEMSKDLNISNSVIFTGFRHDVAELLKVVDVYLQVGDRPNIGTTTLEAMASAKPLIIVAQGEEERVMASETLIDGENGLIVDDIPEVIAAQIVYLLKDKETAAKMGQVSRRIVEDKFDQQNHVKMIEELYKTMIETGRV
jgi:glycosyltransferase involved in cell wall biosynthesis